MQVRRVDPVRRRGPRLVDVRIIGETEVGDTDARDAGEEGGGEAEASAEGDVRESWR